VKLHQPFSLNLVRALRKTVDLYYYRGVPVARRWPRPSATPPTQAQLAARNAFATVNRHIRNMPPDLRTLWQTYANRPESSWADFLKRVSMPLEIEGTLRTPLPITNAFVITGFPSGGNTLRIDWDPAARPSEPPWAIMRKLTTQTDTIQPWQFVGWSQDRGRRVRKIYAPNWAGWEPQQPNLWDDTAGISWYFVDQLQFWALATLIDPAQSDPTLPQHPPIRLAP